MVRSAKLNDSAWADVCAQLSWNDIRDAQRATRGLAEHDFDSLAVMTVAAARRWSLDDLGKIGGIEHRVLVTVPENDEFPAERWPDASKDQEVKLLAAGARVFKGFLDVVLDAGSEVVIVDWKTAGDVGPAWRDRVRHSWQAKLYAWAYKADRVVFRGVQRDGRTTEVVVDWPIRSPHSGNVAYGNGDAEQYVRNAFAIRESQTGHPWAQSMPHACRAYGRECERWASCESNETPGGVIGNEPLSHSAIELLLLCPERYRQSRLLADADADDDARTALGRAFHSGMEEMYTQLRRLA